MQHPSYGHLLRHLSPRDRRGPVGLILIDDPRLLVATVQNLRTAGVATILGLGPEDLPMPHQTTLSHSAPFDCHHPAAMAAAVTALIQAVPGAWLVPLWAGQRLVWPHGDTRPLSDLFAFLGDERREVLGGVELDLYPDTEGHWHFDRLGYDTDPSGSLHGGLRTRIGPPCPAAHRRIDRPLAVKARPGLRMGRDGRLSEEALNTLHCDWHHSPTAALLSPRVWTWCRAQPDHHCRTTPLLWPGSHRWHGSAGELWELGLIEPGQWV